MLFNSIDFVYFFAFTLVVGNLLGNKWQKLFFLFASYYFYMAWKPANVVCSEELTFSINWISYLFCETGINAYVFILIFSTIIDYVVALQLEKNSDNKLFRRVLLCTSLFVNIGTLGFFKYTNFLLIVLGDLRILNPAPQPLDLVLPVGISFYTFQSMSYTIDVFFGKIKARSSFLDFSLYVAFFPQLVAGPIVRAETFFRDLDSRLLVQKENIRIASALILIGFTRKIVFADNLAKVVDHTFLHYETLNPIEIWTGALAFGWQIYFDFAGYTDIAIGVARLFGFQFDPNFNFPMACRNIADHWSKWHISFSTWIRDYIYIPLGGSRVSSFNYVRNIMITWLFAGLWHGAAYHYVSWGLWQGAMLLIHKKYSETKICAKLNQTGGIVYDIGARIFTMFCLAFGFVMFRAENMEKALSMMKSLLFLGNSQIELARYMNYRYGILLIICYLASYLFRNRKVDTVTGESGYKFPLFVLVNVYLLIFFGVTENQSFLYFQF